LAYIQNEISLQQIGWDTARDKGKNNVPMQPDRFGQAHGGTNFAARQVIKWKRHQNDFISDH